MGTIKVTCTLCGRLGTLRISVEQPHECQMERAMRLAQGHVHPSQCIVEDQG